jgi:hypothetical protein
MNCQQYDKEKFLDQFSQTEIFKKIRSDYKYLYSDFREIDLPESKIPALRGGLNELSIFVYSIFYYLNFLTELDPKTIADIGCGSNFLKKYIPEIIGFDKTTEADIFSYFDKDFLENNLQKFDCAIAINSLHFISLKDFSKRINDFGKIIKPGGRGCVTFNLQRMLERTALHEFAEIFEGSSKTITVMDYYNFLKEEIKKIDYKIITQDFTFIADYDNWLRKKYEIHKGSGWPLFDEAINGNYNNIPDHIIKEINLLVFNGEFERALDDRFNGNIRLVFEVSEIDQKFY